MNVLMQKLPQPINILVVQFNTLRCGDHFAPKTFSHVSPTTTSDQHLGIVTFLLFKSSEVGPHYP